MALDVMSMIARLGIDSSEYKKGLREAEGDLNSFSGGMKNLVSSMKKVVAAIGIGAAVKKGVDGIVSLTKSAVNAYGEYEQLVGGVDTLFKGSSKRVQEYAANAYKTAGMSANQYMETVTGFSASLIQSLGGDTKAAADLADQAIRDMSDNANKMGSDISSIQNAYQGFAKGNYTMLDNLKLGYGGTKEEMDRLITDAMKLDSSFQANTKTVIKNKKQVKELDYNYADVVRAINIVQTNMGITGTTAAEAADTIQGSIAATKAAWENVLTAIGTGKGMKQATKNLVTSAGNVIKNVKPVIQRALSGIGDLVVNLAPQIIRAIPQLVSGIVPGIMSTAGRLAGVITKALPRVWTGVKNYVSQRLFPAVSKLIASALGRGNTSLMGERLTGTFRSIFDKVVSVVEGIGAKVGEFWTKVLQPILGDIVEFVLFYVLPLADQLLEAVSPALEWLGGVVSTVFQTIANLWNGTLMPVIMDIYYWIVNTLIPAVTEKWKEWSPVVKDVFDKIKAFWEDPLKPALDELYKKVVEEIIPAVKEKFEEWAPVVQAVFQKIVDVWNDPLKPTFQKLFAWAAETLPGAFNTLKDVFDKVWEFVSTTFAPVFDTLKGALMGDEEATTKLKDAMVAILPWITGAAAAFVAYKTAVAIGSIIDAVTKSTAGLSVAQAILNAVMNANPFVLIASLLAGVAAALVTAYETNDDFRNKVDTAWKDIKQWASDTFEPVVKWFKDVGDTLDNLWHTYMEPVCNWVTDTFVGAWESLKTGLSDLVDFISGVFSGDWQSVWDKLVDMVKTPFDTLGEILKTPINAVIELINSMIKKVESAINKVINGINNKLNIDLTWNLPDWMGGGQYGWKWNPNLKTVSWNTIPLLASGGIVGNGGEAIVGEYRPEHLRVVNGKAVVTPLNTGRFPGGGQEVVVPRTQTPKMINLTLKIRDTEIARVLLPLLEAEEQRRGVRLATGGV